MKNLITVATQEITKRKNDWLDDLKTETSIDDILAKWHYRGLIPASSKHKEWASVQELKNYLLKRTNKRYAKEVEEKVNRINTVYDSKDIESIKISMEWKKSQMWGMNPRAEAVVIYKDGGGERFESGSIGGCGYDKGSTAVAECLNQINGLLKRLYKEKNKNTDIDNRELFGYGSGSQLLPCFEGGVGVSCYDQIMSKIKLDFQTIASGKTYDVYTVSKRAKKAA